MAHHDVIAAVGSFEGKLLVGGDAGYEEARRIHNGMIDKRPALIARCRSTADVAAAVNAARENGMELSVRGGGHNVAGRAVTDGGLMIDLSLMQAVVVDPDRRVARAEGGATWGVLDRATQAHGLAVTGGMISSTGIAGLTLGGGLGWLMGCFGLTADNLLSAEAVTADGSVLVASETSHPDLFWALRGGGGNFGVVTSFEYRLHAVGPVVTGLRAVYPYDHAGTVLRLYRDLTGKARMARAKERLVRWLDDRLHFGFSEWNAPGYYDEHFTALFNLADFCLDEQIRRRAVMVLDLMVFDLARFNHAGSFGEVNNVFQLFL